MNLCGCDNSKPGRPKMKPLFSPETVRNKTARVPTELERIRHAAEDEPIWTILGDPLIAMVMVNVDQGERYQSYWIVLA